MRMTCACDIRALRIHTVGYCPNQVEDLKTLKGKLVSALLSTKKGKTTNKAHKGVSLGKIVVSGGVYLQLEVLTMSQL